MDEKTFNKDLLAHTEVNQLAWAYSQAVIDREATIKSLGAGQKIDVLYLMALATYVHNRVETNFYEQLNKQHDGLAEALSIWWESTVLLLNRIQTETNKSKDIGILKGYLTYLRPR